MTRLIMINISLIMKRKKYLKSKSSWASKCKTVNTFNTSGKGVIVQLFAMVVWPCDRYIKALSGDKPSNAHTRVIIRRLQLSPTYLVQSVFFMSKKNRPPLSWNSNFEFWNVNRSLKLSWLSVLNFLSFKVEFEN